MLTVVPGDGSGHEGGKDHGPSLIDEIVREGARRMLAEALQAEVAVSDCGPPLTRWPRAGHWEPRKRRRFWMNRSNSAAKCSASRAARVKPRGHHGAAWPLGDRCHDERVYAHVLPELRQEAADAIDELFGA